MDSASAHGGDDWAETPAARSRVAGVVTAARPAVICAHRQNLSWLLAQVCAAISAPVPEGPALHRAAFWVLQVGGRRLASAEQHRVEAGPHEGFPGVAAPG